MTMQKQEPISEQINCPIRGEKRGQEILVQKNKLEVQWINAYYFPSGKPDHTGYHFTAFNDGIH